MAAGRDVRDPGDRLRRTRHRDRRRQRSSASTVRSRGRTRIGRGCRLDGTSWPVDATLADGVHLLFGCWVQEAEVGAARDRRTVRAAAAGHAPRRARAISETSSRPRRRCSAPARRPTTSPIWATARSAPTATSARGTITCNYDGFEKHFTRIGDACRSAATPSSSRPSAVADDAHVAAGTHGDEGRPAGALAVSRSPHQIVEGWVGALPRPPRRGR